MAQALTQLQLDLSELYEEHDSALSLSDEYKDAGPGDAMYDSIFSEMKSKEKTSENLARLVRDLSLAAKC